MRQLKPADRGGRQAAAVSKVRRRRPWRRIVLACAALPVAVILLLWDSDWLGRQRQELGKALLVQSAAFGFAVEDVLVSGRERTTQQSILKTLGLARGIPILAIDPEAGRQRLESLPWIARATVERRLPNIIRIGLVERRPMALWQHKGDVTVIDSEGKVIPKAVPGRFAMLPLVVGEDAPEHTADLLAMLSGEPSLRPLVTAAVRVSGRRWNLKLKGGIDVRLPEVEAARAWAELARMEREHRVLAREVVTIDLRLSDRLILRMAPEAGGKKSRRGKGKDT